MTAHAAPSDDRSRFLSALFDAAPGFIDVRGIPPDGGGVVRMYAESVGEALAIVDGLARANNVHVGVCTRRSDAERSTRENLAVAVAAAVDFDDLDAADPMTDMARRLGRLPPDLRAPSMLVETSPARMHVWWLFAEPLAVDTEGGITHFESIQKGLAATLGGDANATDAARVMRVPGTQNRPNEKKRILGRGTSPCTLLAHDAARRFAVELFAPVRVATKPRVRDAAPGEATARLLNGSALAAVSPRVRSILDASPELDRVFAREDRSRGAGSASDLDFALACALARGGCTQGEIVAAIAESRSRDERDEGKSSRRDYLERTVRAALATTGGAQGGALERAAKVARIEASLRGFSAGSCFAESGQPIPVDARRWALPGVLPLGVHGLLVAPGGGGKGLVSIAMASHIALGLPIVGVRQRETAAPEPVRIASGERRGVLLVQREDDEPEMRRRILAFHALRQGAAFADGIRPDERSELARLVHVAAIGGEARGAELDREFLEGLVTRAARVPELALVILDPLGRFLVRDDEGRALRFIEGEWAAAVSEFSAELATRTGACVLLVHHVSKASRAAAREGGDAAAGARGEGFGSTLLGAFARFSLSVERIRKEQELTALRLAPDLSWLRIAPGKSNYGDSGLALIAEQVAGAVRFADMGAMPLEVAHEDTLPDRTPAELGLMPGETVSASEIARKLCGQSGNPSARQIGRARETARAWAARSLVRPIGGSWKILSPSSTESRGAGDEVAA